MSQCSVCERADSAMINTALSHGAGIRKISRDFGIPKTTVMRHARHATSHPEEPDMPTPPIGYSSETERPALQGAEDADVMSEIAPLLAAIDAVQGQVALLTAELGQQRARNALVERRLGEIEGRVQALAGQVGRHGLIVTTAHEVLDLLRTNDDAWQTMDSLLQMGSTSTRGVLYQVVAEKVGRPRPLKYIRQ